MSVDELLPELIVDIFCRLPVKVLLQIRCVSKKWRTLIDSQAFIKAHLSLSRRNPFLIVSKVLSDDMESVDLEFLENPVDLHTPLHHQPLLKRFRLGGMFVNKYQHLPERQQIIIPRWLRFKSQEGMILVWGTCNGLVLMSSPSSITCVWNPSTRKHISLPILEVLPSSLRRPRHLYGFGYDSACDDYKVVKILNYEDPTRYPESDLQYQVWVYRLQSNSWRQAKSFPRNMKCERQPGVLVCETLHWPVKVKSELDHEERDFILAFDLETEEYRMFSQPICQNPEFYSRLGTLNGSLCLIYSYLLVGFEIWVMGDHGVDESWTRRTLQLEDFISYPGGFTKTTLNATNGNGALARGYAPPFFPDIGLYVKTPWYFGIERTDHSDVCIVSLVSLEVQQLIS